MPTLTFSRPSPVIVAVPDTTSIATPVSKNEISLAESECVDKIPVAVSAKEPVSKVKSPWLTIDWISMDDMVTFSASITPDEAISKPMKLLEMVIDS